MDNLVTFTAVDAKAHFGEMLDEALQAPVILTRSGRATFYVVSKRDYEALQHRIRVLESQLND